MARRQFSIPVLFVGAPWLQQVLRDIAQDLWSVRTMVARVEPRITAQIGGRSSIAFERGQPAAGPDPELALSEANRLRAQGGKDLAVARLLYRAGLGFAARYQWRDAVRAFEESLKLRRKAGSDSLAWTLEYDQAAGLLSEARFLYHSAANSQGEANCIRSLGDIEVAQGNTAAAGDRWRAALRLYERIPEPYSIGWSYRRLARISPDAREREAYLAAARAAWQSIGRDDLIASLEQDFGPASAPPLTR